MGEARLVRLAVYAAAHLAFGVTLLVLQPASDVPALAFLVLALPLLFAWGPFQAHVTLNGGLDDAERTRWRIALWLFPWSMTLYWLLYVRPAT